MPKANQTNVTSTSVETQTIEETMTTETIETVEATETVEVVDTATEAKKIPANASFEEKQAFASAYRVSNPKSLLGALPSELVFALNEDQLNNFLDKESLLDVAELDRILIKNLEVRQAKRDASGVLTGFKTDSANVVDISLYVPVGMSEADIVNLVTNQ